MRFPSSSILGLFGGAALLLACSASSSNDSTDGGGTSSDASRVTRDATGGEDDDGPNAVEPGSDGGGAETDGGGAAEADGGVVSVSDAAPLDAGAAPVRPSSACDGDAGVAVTGTVNLSYGGSARDYLLHMPTLAATGPRPLVVNLHPYTANSAAQESITGMSALADTEGFVVAYPDGMGNPQDWNAGACCSAASEGDRDDEGFISKVVDDIGAHTCIDLARVYVTGFSNGGMMTVRLACELADKFAAAATVSGTATVPLDTCKPSRPIAFMHIHGNNDPLVPYDGGAGGLPLSGRPTPIFPAVADEIKTFRSDDGCPATSDVSFDKGNAQCDHWGPCTGESEVFFCTIDGGAHAWPGGSGAIFTEASDLDATKQIWQFFKGHALR